MSYEAINFAEKLSLFQEAWQPKVIARMNDYQFKLVKLRGEFVWHEHSDTDETFLVLSGKMRIEFRDGRVDLKAGEMYVVNKGIEHKPVSDAGAEVLLIEPSGLRNTGSAPDSEFLAENDVWI